MDGWMDGWMGRFKSCVKGCVQKSKIDWLGMVKYKTKAPNHIDSELAVGS